MFLIGGDLNARVKDFLDYIEEDDLNYIYNENVPYPGDVFCLKRKSRDCRHNSFGLSLIDLCCTKDLHILN